MIEFVPFIPEHLDAIRLREEFEARVSVLSSKQGAEMFQNLAQNGCALTIIGNDRAILAVCVWFVASPGIIDIGMFASEDIYSQSCSYLRFARRKFREFLGTLRDSSVRRIQTMSYCDETHDRWMRWLGFDLEGTLKKYSHNGADMRVWSITEV